MALTNDDILVVQSNDDGGLYKVSVKDLNAGALTLISETAPDTDAYEEGTLWFNSKETEANLYVLYKDEDPAGGKKWVQTSGTGGGSGGGGDTSTPTLIIDGTGGAPSPDPYDAGTLWYNSSETDGSLYILYVDAAPDAGKKWVEIASGTGGSSSIRTVIQELEQRVTDRDAVIADFSARIAALEADHMSLMNNGNSSY